MQGWVALAGSLAMIALILMSFALMLGIVKPADAIRRVGAILGVVLLLLVLPGVIVSIWSGISLWRKIGIAGLAILFLVLARARKTARRHRQQ